MAVVGDYVNGTTRTGKKGHQPLPQNRSAIAMVAYFTRDELCSVRLRYCQKTHNRVLRHHQAGESFL